MNTLLSKIAVTSFVLLTSIQAFAGYADPGPIVQVQVPEPSSLALMGTALTIAAFIKFKNRNK